MVTVDDNEDSSQFEIRVDGIRIGRLRYSISDDVITLPHTKIEPAYGGRGHGTSLVTGALDLIRDTGMRVVPQCPFVRSVIDRFPEYKDLVKET